MGCDWGIVWTIIGANIALVGIFLSVIFWIFSKLDGDIKSFGGKLDGDIKSLGGKLDGDIKALTSKIDADMRAHTERTDKLYQMFIDLLKQNRHKTES